MIILLTVGGFKFLRLKLFESEFKKKLEPFDNKLLFQIPSAEFLSACERDAAEK